jgi:hypothetical protein
VVLGVHRNTLHNKLRSQAMLSGYVATIRPRRSSSKRGAASRARSTAHDGGRKE